MIIFIIIFIIIIVVVEFGYLKCSVNRQAYYAPRCNILRQVPLSLRAMIPSVDGGWNALEMVQGCANEWTNAFITIILEYTWTFLMLQVLVVFSFPKRLCSMSEIINTKYIWNTLHCHQESNVNRPCAGLTGPGFAGLVDGSGAMLHSE